MIVVSHEMGFAREAADRVVMMDDGQIIEEGAPEHFFTAPMHERTKAFLSKILEPRSSSGDLVQLPAQHADERQVAVVLAKVEAVADHELVGNGEAAVVDRRSRPAGVRACPAARRS